MDEENDHKTCNPELCQTRRKENSWSPREEVPKPTRRKADEEWNTAEPQQAGPQFNRSRTYQRTILCPPIWIKTWNSNPSTRIRSRLRLLNLYGSNLHVTTCWRVISFPSNEPEMPYAHLHLTSWTSTTNVYLKITSELRSSNTCNRLAWYWNRIMEKA